MGWSYQDLLAAPANLIPVVLSLMAEEAKIIQGMNGKEGGD